MCKNECDYRQMIETMLDKIENNKKLKKIFDYICHVYLKSTD